MGKAKNNDGDSIYEQLTRLEAKKAIPVIIRKENTRQYRWQRKEYPSGLHYGLPTSPQKMGRYNDPSARTGACYTADYPIVSLAEAWGRLYQKCNDKKTFFIGSREIQIAQLYILETTRKTKTIDITRLVGLLHRTLDQVTGNDTSIPQAIVDWAANTPGLDYDGISYPSRHHAVGLCTAFWEREGTSSPLADISHCSVESYVDSDPVNFPQNWLDKDINGFEMLTETLNFVINPDE
ncbi:RES family NAD+ phosphorylase [Lonsdalea quercina]|uniref:RES family NAD+ phosphorylase n=1 Tax=Lonsdalea quercina TaxID=71657 RepID=UPI0039755DA3